MNKQLKGSTPAVMQAVVTPAVMQAVVTPAVMPAATGPMLVGADDRLAFLLTDLTRRVGVGRSTIYGEIAAGRLRARKIGRRTVFLRADVEAWLAAAPPIRPAASVGAGAGLAPVGKAEQPPRTPDTEETNR